MTNEAPEPHPSAPRSRWRLTYQPGPWLALAGPSTAVILQPASPQWSELITTIWEDVLRATSIEDLLGRMAAFRLEQMPSFAAFFWGPDGMRSLVRGDVRLVDQQTEALLLDGSGVQTWTEGAIGDRNRVRVQLATPNQLPSLELPLVIGAVGVSAVIVEAGPDAAAPAPASALEPEPEPEPPTPEPPAPEPHLSNPDWSASGSAAAAPGLASEVTDPDVVQTEAFDPDDRRSGALLHRPTGDPAAQTYRARTVVAVLRPSSGGRVDVDRPILIGRAPSANRLGSEELPRLLTVPSPSRDISRTHLQIAPGDPTRGSVEITDLNSTNGTILRWPDGHRSTLMPDRPVLVGPGAVVDLGDGITIAVDPAGD